MSSQPSANAKELIDAVELFSREWGRSVAKNIAMYLRNPRPELDAFIADLERRVAEAEALYEALKLANLNLREEIFPETQAIFDAALATWRAGRKGTL